MAKNKGKKDKYKYNYVPSEWARKFIEASTEDGLSIKYVIERALREYMKSNSYDDELIAEQNIRQEVINGR